MKTSYGIGPDYYSIRKGNFLYPWGIYFGWKLITGDNGWHATGFSYKTKVMATRMACALISKMLPQPEWKEPPKGHRP